jgi:hypothetical protein
MHITKKIKDGIIIIINNNIIIIIIIWCKYQAPTSCFLNDTCPIAPQGVFRIRLLLLLLFGEIMALMMMAMGSSSHQ